MVCWGYNGSGRATAPSGSFTQVSAGDSHSCGIRTGGSVVCWGHNGSGLATAPDGSFTQVSAGSSHSCGLRSDGSVVCWGHNYFGQATAPSGSFTQVSAGSSHSCGIRTGGSVVCWGLNRYGQATAPDGSFTQVSAGDSHSCGLRSDGSVFCWGDNRSGQATVPDGSFTQVSAGDSHSCGIRSGGSVVCWGYNGDGQATVPDGSFTQVSTGNRHSCGLRSDGSVVCWGDNGYGQATAPSGSFTHVSAGSRHSCGLRSGGSVVCWGYNGSGRATAPSGSFTQVSAGGGHSCGIRTGGSVVCWGHNRYGQATRVPDGSFTQVSAGGEHSCGIRSGGSMVCWGNNRDGQATVPDGSFTQVSAGNNHSCVLRSGGSVVCAGGTGRAVVLTAGSDGGGGSGSGETGGGSAPVPGGVGGLGFEVIGSGRNLFWTPVVGVLEYEIDARESGGDRADYRSGITCLYTGAEGARCGYLFERDRQTSDAFRAASEFRVRAVGDAGAGAWSVWVSVGSVDKPGKVTGVGYRAGGVVWDGVSGADSYDVAWKYGGEDAKTVRVSCCRLPVRQVVGKSIRVAVRGVNDAGGGLWSGWVTVVEGTSRKPGQVTGVKYIYDSEELFWDPLPGVTLYRVFVKYERSGFEIPLRCASRSTCYFTVDRPYDAPAEAYVYAKNSAGVYGPHSETVTIQPGLDTPRIVSLEPLKAKFNVFDREDDVRVRWSAVPGATAYFVHWQFRKLDALDDKVKVSNSMVTAIGDGTSGAVIQSGTCKPGKAGVGKVTEFDVVGVINIDGTACDDNHQLEFSVEAVNSSGVRSEWSDWASFNNAEVLDKMKRSALCTVTDTIDDVGKVLTGVTNLRSRNRVCQR